MSILGKNARFRASTRGPEESLNDRPNLHRESVQHSASDGSLEDLQTPNQLFRSEALTAATSRLGSPVKPLGLNGFILSGFFVVLLLGVAIFLGVGRYARKETVAGVIQPSVGSAKVTTLSSGVISEVFVEEGQFVEAGAPVLKFAADPSVSMRSEAPRLLSGLISAGADREASALKAQAQAQIQAGELNLEDLRARQAGLAADQTALKNTIAIQRERIRLSEQTLEAGRRLNERELFSDLQLRQREEALLAAQQTLGGYEREMQRNAAALQQAKAEEGRLNVQVGQANAEIERLQAQFDQRRAEQMALQGTVLVAGRSGRVVSLQARPGSTVQPGQALATILPNGARLQAELWVPSRAAGFVEPGAPIRLMYDAFPYQKFGIGRGRVLSISGAPTNPADLPVPIETSEALYRVVVAIDDDGVSAYGRRWALVPGMRLSADMILDERSLWEWLLDPIIAARQRSNS